MTSRAWSWRHAIIDSTLEPTTRHVLLTISCYMNDVGGGCYPTVETLVSATGLSRRAVVDHIGRAEKLGWLKISKHGFKGQKWRNNEYSAVWPDLVERLEQPAPKVRKTRAKKAMEEAAQVDELPSESLFPDAAIPAKGSAAGALPLTGSKRGSKAVEVVQLDREGGAPNSTKVVQELHSILPGNFHNPSTSARAPTRESVDEKEGGGFSQFWDEWPSALLPDNRAFVEKLFLDLSPADRAIAAAAAPVYLRATALRKGKPRMVLFLKDRLFDEFHDAPEIDRDGDFVIGPGRPEWEAWIDDIRGRFGEPGVQSAVKLGRIVGKERWPAPPGAAASQSA